MGRHRTVDREALLIAAEVVVTKRGPAALTFEAVAEQAGVSKGGVQSTFPSKASLLDAMATRWIAATERQLVELSGNDQSPLGLLRGYIRYTIELDEQEQAQTSALLVAFAHSDQFRLELRHWYAKFLQAFSALPPQQAATARTAFFASEGLSILQCIGFLPMPDEERRACLGEVLATLDRI